MFLTSQCSLSYIIWCTRRYIGAVKCLGQIAKEETENRHQWHRRRGQCQHDNGRPRNYVVLRGDTYADGCCSGGGSGGSNGAMQRTRGCLGDENLTINKYALQQNNIARAGAISLNPVRASYPGLVLAYSLSNHFSFYRVHKGAIQGWAKKWFPGLVKFCYCCCLTLLPQLD